jgi:hypothetical protein
MPRRVWVPDGYMQPLSRDEVHVFVARATRHTTGQFHINIPKDISRALDLKHGTLVEVAIRIVDEKYASENYGVPKQRQKLPPLRKPRVICPVCSKPGLLCLRRNGTEIRIHHALGDGFETPTVHYVSKRKYSDWVEAHRHLFESRLSEQSRTTIAVPEQSSSEFKQPFKSDSPRSVSEA